MANSGVSVDDVVDVEIDLTPTAAQERNFGNALFLGDSDVIDTTQRFRIYTSSDDVAADLGGSAPEFLAAELFFAQSPQPQECYVGRWASTATHGLLRGAVLNASQQNLSIFAQINAGGMTVTIDGTIHALTGLDFTAQTNLNGVAAVIQTALAGAAGVTWDSNNDQFVLESTTTGSLSSVIFATAPSAGTDISALLGLQVGSGGYAVAGMQAETLAAAVELLADMSTDWYGLQVASTATPSDADYVALGLFIESAKPSRIMGVTTQEPNALSAISTTDLPFLLNASGYRRTFCQYSSSNPFASASTLGRALTVDFDGENTTITLDFKIEPGVVAELIRESQKRALAGKKCNAFLKFNNGTAILQEGWMANGTFIDVIQGTDWLQNSLQTSVYNALLTAPKIPQTDPGVNKLVAALTVGCEQARRNGLFAPGVWTGPDLGSIVTGQTLSKGYYIFAPKVATQAQADREARKSPPLQVAGKLAGAIHSVNVLVSVNA